MEHQNDEPSLQSPEEMSQLWRERYGDMVPEKIIDTKIGADGKRYYKVQWAATTMEPGKNFLEAELLIKKYWDPVEKKLRFPSREHQNSDDEGASSSRQCDGVASSEAKTNENINYEHTEKSEENTRGTLVASNLDFIVADITNESDESETNDIIDTSCNENNASSTVENTSLKEQDDEKEPTLKRKRCNSDSKGSSNVACEKTCENEDLAVEVVAKKARDDDNSHLIQD